MNSNSLKPYLEIALHAADEAGKIICPFFRQPLSPTTKADHSPVTQADQRSENLIRFILHKETPSFNIIGEEFGGSNIRSDYQWVIDPIDGTRAFITGRPLFGTLISLLFKGKPIIGIIDQPILKERWIGVHGQETQFTSSLGGKIGTRLCEHLSDAEASCTSPEILEDAPTQNWKTVFNRVKRLSWGGDCYAYGLLTLGQIDIILDNGNKVWDWAALVPIIEGAGGLITDWQGQQLNPNNTETTVLAMGNPLLKQKVITLLNSNSST